MRDVCLACPVLRGVGGIAVYARTVLGALHGADVRAIGYLDDGAKYPLPSHVRSFVLARNKGTYTAALAREVARRTPTTFLFAHIGLPAPLRLMPRRAHHRFALMLHGIEAWSEATGGRAFGLRALDTLIFTTVFTRDMFLSANARHLRPDVRSIVIPLTIPPELEAVPVPPVAVAPRRRVVCVTRLMRDEPLKGVPTLIRAARHLDPRRFVVDIVGEGTGRGDYERLASELGVADRVRFLGWVSDEARTDAIAAADVLCLPSAQEGFGIVFLEAMALGRPVVGAAAGSVPEVVSKEVGALFPYDDDRALADALRVTAERLHRGELTTSSIRAHYEQRFAFSRFAEQWRKLVDSG